MQSSKPSSSKEVDSPFNLDKDGPPDPILDLYRKLCHGGFEKDNNKLTEEATNPDANTETNSGSKPTKRRKKGAEKWINRKKVTKSSYVPVLPKSQKRKPRQPNKSPLYNR